MTRYFDWHRFLIYELGQQALNPRIQGFLLFWDVHLHYTKQVRKLSKNHPEICPKKQSKKLPQIFSKIISQKS